MGNLVYIVNEFFKTLASVRVMVSVRKIGQRSSNARMRLTSPDMVENSWSEFWIRLYNFD